MNFPQKFLKILTANSGRRGPCFWAPKHFIPLPPNTHTHTNIQKATKFVDISDFCFQDKKTTNLSDATAEFSLQNDNLACNFLLSCKGTVSRDVWLLVFLLESYFSGHLSILLEPFCIFRKISKIQYSNSWCITGVYMGKLIKHN